nr:MAG TPA: hypothetical protein [Bacteriophage sp.]
MLKILSYAGALFVFIIIQISLVPHEFLKSQPLLSFRNQSIPY